MDPRTNPYAPGAGTKPPVLVGRESELDKFDITLHRLSSGYAAQSQIVTGLRGVGKTVLLNAFSNLAEDRQWVTIETEISTRTDLGPLIVRLCRKALLRLDAPARWRDRARRAAQVLASFSLTVDPTGAVTLGGADIEPLAGTADSGLLSEDLADVFLALGLAASEKETGIVFIIDEIQFLAKPDLESLILALHKAAQRALPITLVAAGLPQIPKLAGDAKSYAERLFEFPAIGRLTDADARAALAEPAQAQGVTFTATALDMALDFTEGYPYFLQEIGAAAWGLGTDNAITEEDMAVAIPEVRDKLDSSFFRVRVDRCTDLELAYLRAMAELGRGPQKSGEIATTLGYAGSEELGPTRANLISKGLIYTPGHGLAEFTVPQFDQFMRRYMDLEHRTPQRRTRRD